MTDTLTNLADSNNFILNPVPDTVIKYITVHDTIPATPIINNITSDSGFLEINIGDILTGLLMPTALYCIPLISNRRSEYSRLMRIREGFLNSIMRFRGFLGYEISLMNDNITFLSNIRNSKFSGFSPEISAASLLQYDATDLEDITFSEIELHNNGTARNTEFTDLRSGYFSFRRNIEAIDNILKVYISDMRHYQSLYRGIISEYETNREEIVAIINLFAIGHAVENSQVLQDLAKEITTHYYSVRDVEAQMNTFIFIDDILNKFYDEVEKQRGRVRTTADVNLNRLQPFVLDLNRRLRTLITTGNQLSNSIQANLFQINLFQPEISTFINQQRTYTLIRHWWLFQFGKGRLPVIDINAA